MSSARRYVVPLFRRSIIPVVLLEIFLHFLFQLPLKAFESEDIKQIAAIFGMHKYW